MFWFIVSYGIFWSIFWSIVYVVAFRNDIAWELYFPSYLQIYLPLYLRIYFHCFPQVFHGFNYFLLFPKINDCTVFVLSALTEEDMRTF